ncbi:lipocalin family protein [Hymenobacter edaphi]|uniref:Lipocalin-like domain-containing protein n=1 Tax=Hymenobacter edaphi TaxID=2211146 RepID=A0A328BDS5_9BACT|nr:lipocalin family protein [Hymenobacter edaphi]RAK63994.1 hypothetical protein DLM85_18770 [Hymenobacter edaphi]
MKRISLLAAVAVACVFTACKKDEEKPKSTSELLMAKSWKITAYTEQVGSAAATDEYASADACLKDNIYKFEASNKFTTDEGTTKCDPTDPQSVSGNWALTNSDKTLTAVAVDQATFTSFELTGSIDEISASKFVLSESETAGGTTTVSKTTFTAQ